MIGTVRRMHLLTVLVLLLSGLFQSLAVAQGVTCTQTHAPAQATEQSSESDDLAAPSGAFSIEHMHDSAPQPGELGVPAAPCGVAALPAERSQFSPVTTARHLLPQGDLPPASRFTQSLFRPPRLS